MYPPAAPMSRVRYCVLSPPRISSTSFNFPLLPPLARASRYSLLAEFRKSQNFACCPHKSEYHNFWSKVSAVVATMFSYIHAYIYTYTYTYIYVGNGGGR